MCRFARDGRHLANLVSEAAAVCRAADGMLPKAQGPGRPEIYQQWQIASLILITIFRRCKSKSSQHRFLKEHEGELSGLLRNTLKLQNLPSRATYMRRYGACHPLLAKAILVGGRRALQEHVADAEDIAVDKSMIEARGPRPPRRKSESDKGVDPQAGFGKSMHDGWVWGYSYEVAVSAGKNGVVVPLLASADTASASEHRTCLGKIPDLPASWRNLLVDSGYDSNALGEAVEYTPDGRRSGRHLVCPLQHRGGKPCVGRQKRKGARERSRLRREARYQFIQTRRGKRLIARRRQTVEPFNQWFKHLFDLEERVWHRGLDNNRTMLLIALFGYQLLQRYNFAIGNRDGAVKWLLDAL
jgi:Transposase DDE domain